MEIDGGAETVCFNTPVLLPIGTTGDLLVLLHPAPPSEPPILVEPTPDGVSGRRAARS